MLTIQGEGFDAYNVTKHYAEEWQLTHNIVAT